MRKNPVTNGGDWLQIEHGPGQCLHHWVNVSSPKPNTAQNQIVLDAVHVNDNHLSKHFVIYILMLLEANTISDKVILQNYLQLLPDLKTAFMKSEISVSLKMFIASENITFEPLLWKLISSLWLHKMYLFYEALNTLTVTSVSDTAWWKNVAHWWRSSQPDCACTTGPHCAVCVTYQVSITSRTWCNTLSFCNQQNVMVCNTLSLCNEQNIMVCNTLSLCNQ